MKGTENIKGLKAKARALEDSFFANENTKLLKELREASVREEKRKEFQEYLNIDNEEIINALVELEVEPETLVAFSLVPLVEVAWADGVIQPKERDAIIKAAIERGVADGSPTCTLLRNWLLTKPDPRLLEVWRGYVEAVMGSQALQSTPQKRYLGSGASHCRGRRWISRCRFNLRG
jgi:hypothetical protein